MPKFFGLNLVGLLATSVAFFFLGFVWYDQLFDEQWMDLMKIDAAAPEAGSMLPLLAGFLNVVVISFGIGLVLKWLNVTTLITAVKYGIVLAISFALTTEAYTMIYAGTPTELFYINGAYNLIGYAMVAAIWSFFSD